MQICATIMRLVVILSVLVQIYANTGSAPWTRHGLLVAGPNPVTAGTGRSIGSVAGEERASGPAEDKRPERNVYRTKLSKLRLILLADMLNEILELITCLANSSALNVTTKHCDCETNSCKDLLAGSSPSPLNYIQPKRKIHTSCREHCCRKKKFNRSIDPAALENVVTSSRRYNTVPGSSTVHRSSAMGSALSLTAGSGISKGMQPSETPSFRLRTTGLPSPAGVRDHRDRPAAAAAAKTTTTRACNSDGIDQASIANNRVHAVPWLYRVGLIETKHPVCVGALIHPSLILTTAVCVINKKPEELVVWSGRPVRMGEAEEWTGVGRIMLPEQFATTFERLENNVALLLLVHGPTSPPPLPSQPTDAPRPIGRSLPTGVGLRAWPVSVRNGGVERNLARTVQLFPGQRKRTPTSICLSSIIDRTPDTAESSCYAVSFRKTNLSHSRTTAAAAPQPTATGSSSTDTGANNWLPNDGTNYVTTNISIFPATECRPEHREYLQHDGNLCAGYGAAKNRSIDVDFSGSPLICDEVQDDGKIHRTVQGLLTWSTDINHAPHLFTNLTTYRPWIDRAIAKLDSETQRSQPVPRPTVRSVLYG